ncbi:MAG: hypothetical protein QW273_01710 [Candidatus Pacearchaeota archaeon]
MERRLANVKVKPIIPPLDAQYAGDTFELLIAARLEILTTAPPFPLLII